MSLSDQWHARYQPASRLLWRGRRDGPGATRFHEITHFVDLREGMPKIDCENNYAFLGFASDAGIQRNFGRTGADKGPEALKQALSNIPVDPDTPIALYDVGRVSCHDGNLEEAQHSLGEVVAQLLLHKIHPVILGGGHETAWAHFQGIAKHLGQENVGIVNFDAHFDLRPLLENDLGSSGTPFTQIARERKRRDLPFHYLVLGLQRHSNTPALFQHARELSVDYVLADSMHLHGLSHATEILEDFIRRHRYIYLSVDLDVFASCYAPGVSAPQALGLSPWQVLPLLKILANSGKVISMDVCELSPEHDQDGRTSQLAATLLANYIQPGF